MANHYNGICESGSPKLWDTFGRHQRQLHAYPPENGLPMATILAFGRPTLLVILLHAKTYANWFLWCQTQISNLYEVTSWSGYHYERSDQESQMRWHLYKRMKIEWMLMALPSIPHKFFKKAFNNIVGES